MKITRAQIRALELKTRGFVDEMVCELDSEGSDDILNLQFHHIRVNVTPTGRYNVVSKYNGDVISEGQIERVTNSGIGRGFE